MINEILDCKVRGFWAPDEPDLCMEFTKGHQNVLKQHGYEHFKSNNTEWHRSSSTYVVVASCENEVIGGLRLVNKKITTKLPMELTIEPMDNGVNRYFDRNIKKNPYEVCALWNSKKIAGMRLPHILSRLGLVLSPHINSKLSVCFMASFTFHIPDKLGYNIVREIGNNGFFNYPTPEFRAAVWAHQDIDVLEECDEFERSRIFSLRKNLKQEYLEPNGRQGIQIKYELNL